MKRRAPCMGLVLVCTMLAACGEAPWPGDGIDGGDGVDGGTEASVPGDDGPMNDRDASIREDGRVVRGPYATSVVTFEPGEGASFGHTRMPDIVLGPPVGGGDSQGGTDVVSLGRNGRICLRFDDVTVVDGEGPDFIVFENAFYASGSSVLFDELGEVSVSEDGETFVTFPCDPTAMPPSTTCAGQRPVYSTPVNGIAPDDLTNAGGDRFDLRTVGIARMRVVCIRDLATRSPAPPSTGFDLDAVTAVNSTPR